MCVFSTLLGFLGASTAGPLIPHTCPLHKPKFKNATLKTVFYQMNFYGALFPAKKWKFTENLGAGNRIGRRKECL